MQTEPPEPSPAELRGLRHAAGLSLESAAARIGIHASSLSRYETEGGIGRRSRVILRAILDCYATGAVGDGAKP
jgi:transcriptional regulator with XRE-family HTH domain